MKTQFKHIKYYTIKIINLRESLYVAHTYNYMMTSVPSHQVYPFKYQYFFISILLLLLQDYIKHRRVKPQLKRYGPPSAEQ